MATPATMHRILATSARAKAARATPHALHALQARPGQLPVPPLESALTALTPCRGPRRTLGMCRINTQGQPATSSWRTAPPFPPAQIPVGLPRLEGEPLGPIPTKRRLVTHAVVAL